MYYVDTSVVAPLAINEPTSGSVEAMLRRLPAGSVATSAWTRVELASAISRRVRMGEMAENEADEASTAFERILSDSFHILIPVAGDFATAVEFLGHRTGLRAGDALHLAVAYNHGELAILSLDAGLVKAARLLGLQASSSVKGH